MGVWPRRHGLDYPNWLLVSTDGVKKVPCASAFLSGRPDQLRPASADRCVL